MQLPTVSLDDRFVQGNGHHVLTGTQALLLALIRQRRFDRLRGLATAGFLSGYRGSPLSSLDTEAWKIGKLLSDADIRFVPGINEELAMTAIAGTQHVALDPRANVSGVFGMWYGKGAGLDRSGDALRHAHGAGSSRNGGVLVVCGDDHALKSSSQAYHSEPTFIDMQMPVLYPADIQELLDFALLGWEMSRYSGCYVGLKVLAEHVNSTAIVDVGLGRASVSHPAKLPANNDRWIRWPDPWPDVERRLLDVKLPAALEFAKANQINRVMISAPAGRLGIVAAGKSYSDLMQAFDLLGLKTVDAKMLGISVYKIGMPWPADEEGLRDFCLRHETILVIEEKRDLLEKQICAALYASPGERRPVVLGRKNRRGQPQFHDVGELDASDILKALAPEISPWLTDTQTFLLNALTVGQNKEVGTLALPPRAPYFCSGCPHNTSTRVPDGSRALAGVGCHFMATGMDREATTLPQMGGEGASWIGTSPFTDTKHVFVNLGEGTYFHSGILAIRAALAAEVNATYKILFNDAIAMTGGQPVEGELSVPLIVRQLQAEGIRNIEVVAEDVQPYKDGRLSLPSGVSLSSRESLDEVQRRMRDLKGVSALIYDQVCATEKRRRRKRGKFPEAPRRVFINERVCEGCGDCSEKSNCMSVVPVETSFGRKRAIDQFNCNQDYSCIDGFCPSFVTVEGARLRKAEKAATKIRPIPPVPALRGLGEHDTFNVLVSGVGGTGVVTIGALLGMAAHLEGKAFTIHDKLGMAQKYGAVNSHLRISLSPDALNGVRLTERQADLVIGGDLGVAAEGANLKVVDPQNTEVVVATEQAVGGDFVRNPDVDFGTVVARRAIERAAPDRAIFVHARHIALSELGDEIGANLLLVGYVWQKGLLPLSEDAIMRAIELNAVAVELNKRAFLIGRQFASQPEDFAGDIPTDDKRPENLNWEELVAQRAAFLSDYQDSKYAARYRALVQKAADAERSISGKPGALTHAVAENFARLLAYKDEYEVARLYSDGVFRRSIENTFEDTSKMSFYLAPPIFGKRNPKTGMPQKIRFGAWIIPVFRVLSRLKRLRGTPFDLFGYHPERIAERSLIAQYQADLERLIGALDVDNLDLATKLAALPKSIRGYGHIKIAAIEKANRARAELLKGAAPGNGNIHVPAAAE
jgi:indolepyruvate ferredoxin oxidoreductase